MPSDRHTELRNMAHVWIENKTFKRISVPECNAVGYTADLVVVGGLFDEFHTRWTKHSGLEKKIMVRNWEDEEKKSYEVQGDIDRWCVCVFEVKVSRNDFLATFGNSSTPHTIAHRSPVGTAHWVVADKNVCKPEELPDFWGLLEPYGPGLTEQKIPKLNVISDEVLHAIAFDMIWLEKNFRRSRWEHTIEMAKSIGDLRTAIRNNEPREKLLLLSAQAKETCKGLIWI